MDRASFSEELSSEPPPKRSKSGGSRKVCIIFWCEVNDVDEYSVFMVDLDSFKGNCDGDGDGDGSGVVTKFRLKHDAVPPRATMCVLGSKLYIFEGCSWKENVEGGTSVLCVDLESSSEDKVSISPCPIALKYPKIEPFSVPRPDGKGIIVFSSFLYLGFKDFHFELYTPGGSSQLLPSISMEDKDDEFIASYGFIKESLFMVRTSKLFFLLDLDSLDKGWERRDWYRGLGRVPTRDASHFFFVADEQFYFSSCATYDIGSKYCVAHYHDLPPIKKPYNFVNAAISPLDYDIDTGKCRFCLLQSFVTKDVYDRCNISINLRINVYCTDIKQYKEDGGEDCEALIKTSITQTLDFAIPPADVHHYDVYMPLGIFPFLSSAFP